MIDLETRIELMLIHFAAIETRLQEIEEEIDRAADAISNN